METLMDSLKFIDIGAFGELPTDARITTFIVGQKGLDATGWTSVGFNHGGDYVKLKGGETGITIQVKKISRRRSKASDSWGAPATVINDFTIDPGLTKTITNGENGSTLDEDLVVYLTGILPPAPPDEGDDGNGTPPSGNGGEGGAVYTYTVQVTKSNYQTTTSITTTDKAKAQAEYSRAQSDTSVAQVTMTENGRSIQTDSGGYRASSVTPTVPTQPVTPITPVQQTYEAAPAAPTGVMGILQKNWILIAGIGIIGTVGAVAAALTLRK